jgi:DNA polymerase
MKRAEYGYGFNLVGHVHDELIAMEREENGGSVEQLELAMESPIDWAPGLPLAAEGWEGEFYMKG